MIFVLKVRTKYHAPKSPHNNIVVSGPFSALVGEEAADCA